MNNATITPSQIKSISGTIRSLETERLGSNLPNATLLNGITRALGLGKDFRSFQAAYKATQHSADPSNKSGTATPELEMSHLVIVTNAEPGRSPTESEIYDQLLEDNIFSGWELDIVTAHGTTQIMAWNADKSITLEDIKNILGHIQKRLPEIRPQSEGQPSQEVMYWQKYADTPSLFIDFVYHDNHQVCSASVCETAWTARKMTSMSDEEALLVLYGDVEISDAYTAQDITVDNVFVDRKVHDET